MSPQKSLDAMKYAWGVNYTNTQNKRSLGIVHGEVHQPYLQNVYNRVRSIRDQISASHVCICGSGSSGFGLLQLAAYDPVAFDIAGPVASYVIGTQEPTDSGHSNYNTTQPSATENFHRWLDNWAGELANVPALLAVQAKRDRESSYRGVETVVRTVRDQGGRAELFTVPENKTDSDQKNGKKRSTTPGRHFYFKYVRLDEKTETFSYERLRRELDRIPPRSVKPPHADFKSSKESDRNR